MPVSTPTPVMLLREMVGKVPYTPLELRRVLDHVGGDVDLAYTALMMRPRPSWLHTVATKR